MEQRLRINLLSLFLCLLFAPGLSAQLKNIALGKPVHGSSEDPANPASNAVDGKISRHSKWKAANSKAPHTLEIDLQRYYDVSGIAVHSGLLDEEKSEAETTQAAGFWSIKNFRLQYWDDANWTDLPGTEVLENRLTTAAFTFTPAVTTFKIRLVVDDGEPISVMELEVFGKESPNMPVPPVAAPAATAAPTGAAADREVAVTVRTGITGRSMKFVGYNQGYYFPGSNASDWLEYSQVNSLRVWALLDSFVPESAVQVDTSLSTLEIFEKRKEELRANPENNPYIRWNLLYPLYDTANYSSTNGMVLNYALAELKRLNIAVILQVGSTDFDDTWSNKWKQWQRYYALAYYTAKTGDVAMFAMQNEPNHRHSGPMRLDRWIIGMRVVSDAIHRAVEDVNKRYGKRLDAKFFGPVTAGQNTDWWAGVVKAIRTDYRGNPTDKDLIDVFSTHSYNSPAAGYESRITNIRKIITDNHPAGRPLPIVFTEIGRWMNAYLIDKEETMDSPSLFTEWAGIYSNNMKNGGYGMWAFKFANTASSTYPRGIKSGHHLTWQGRRFVEDAHPNIALGAKVTASAGSTAPSFVTDGNKSDASAWISDSIETAKWVEINLGSARKITGAMVYTGSSYGVYTGPDRIRDFALQYQQDGVWKTIPGAEEKGCKYVQVFLPFQQPVTADKIRFTTTDKGTVKLREIKLFGDALRDGTSYDIGGIQRTGEVVRLFAKGFKDERPLLETVPSVTDTDLDTYTSHDEGTGNYYMWLVQRGTADYHLDIDVSSLGLAASTPVTGELVDSVHYGEVAYMSALPANGRLRLKLPARSVMLLTIAGQQGLIAKTVTATADATVTGAGLSKKTGREKELAVSLDAAHPAGNQVSFIRFPVSPRDIAGARRILLRVNGLTDDMLSRVFRMHVYAIPSAVWNEKKLTWANAPQLDPKEALIRDGGQKAFFAGQLAFTSRQEDHYLDVTDLVCRYAAKEITFVLVRETRHMGDDEDKGRQVLISSRESAHKPALLLWSAPQQDITLASHGRALYDILLTIGNPTETQQYAAAELKKYLDRISGAAFTVKMGAASGPALKLSVKEKNPREGYTLSVNKKNVLISGNSDAALLCAVYDLLARLGCAWLAPDFDVYEGNAEFVPSRSVLVFRSTSDIRQTPRFAYRKLDVDGGRTHNAENLEKLIEWMPKGGYNTLRVPVNLNNNGRVVWDGWRERLAPQLKKRGLLLEVGGHGYQAFINAEMENGMLFNNHPEWFGKDSSCNYIPSERLVFNTANPEAVQYFIRNIVDYLKQRPEIDIFGLWPPDVGRWADCPEWRSLGTPADRQALLANQVDSALKTIHKELRLEILAYSFTLSPPQKVKLHPGIQVDICPIDQSFEHQIYDPASANNSEYAREIKAWRDEFPGELGLYSYYRKYAWRSAPNVIPNYIQRDMQWYAGIPLQGISTYCEPGDWFTYELNHYVLGHVARNPVIDVDSLSRVFFRVRFGRQWQEAGNAYAHLQEIMPVYGSTPFTSRKPAEKIAAALKKIQHQRAVIKEAVKTADQVPAGNFARLLLMYEYAQKDLQIQHALASEAAVPEIQRQIRELVVFLEANLDKGVFLLTGQNDFARFTKKYGLTNQSLLD